MRFISECNFSSFLVANEVSAQKQVALPSAEVKVLLAEKQPQCGEAPTNRGRELGLLPWPHWLSSIKKLSCVLHSCSQSLQMKKRERKDESSIPKKAIRLRAISLSASRCLPIPPRASLSGDITQTCLRPRLGFVLFQR